VLVAVFPVVVEEGVVGLATGLDGGCGRGGLRAGGNEDEEGEKREEGESGEAQGDVPRGMNPIQSSVEQEAEGQVNPMA